MRSITTAFPLFLALAACGGGSGAAADAGDTPDSTTIDDGGNIHGWLPIADVGRGPVQETAVAELGGKIYVIGGFEGGAITPAVQVYDPATDRWSEAAPLPRSLHHANAAAVDGKLYVLGALVTINFTAIGDVFEYDPGADAWTARTSMPAGTERGASAVGVIDGRIFLAGGFRGSSVADVSAYDPATDTWEAGLPALPEARDHLMGGAVDGKLYAIGGRNGGIGALRAQVDIYDPVAREWTSGAPMPTARGGAAAGVVDGVIVVVGGEGNAASPTGVFPQTEGYDPATNTWAELPDMRTPRHGMGAAGFDGKLYVPGGATVQAFGAVATSEVFIP